MLLASYRYKQPGSTDLVPAGAGGGGPGFIDSQGAIDLLCWKCHQRQLEDEGSGLLARTREARRQMRSLTVERRALQSEREMFLKAHQLDSEKLGREADELRTQRRTLRKETELLAAERRSRLAEQALSPKLKGTALRPRAGESDEVWVQLAAADPDHNPADSADRPATFSEPQSEASKRRKKDLIFLKSIYSAGSGSPQRGPGSQGRRRGMFSHAGSEPMSPHQGHGVAPATPLRRGVGTAPATQPHW